MAKYDPQRPRPVSDVNDSPQLDALLSPVTPAAVATPPDAATPSGRSAASTDPLGADSSAGPASTLREAAQQPTLTRGSPVPVAPPPSEGTANRAVLGAVFAAALGALIALLVVRRRRSPRS